MEKLEALERLVDSLKRLPSVGSKSAERMAFALLDMSDDVIEEFSKSLLDVKKKIHPCPICGSLTEHDICSICSDERRDHSTILLVSSRKDVFVIEEVGEYKGLYHVLEGSISLTKGIGIDSLKIPELMSRIEKGNVKEVIIATNATIDGETTALYLHKLLSKYPLEVTRIAYGLPIGANLDYTDSLTLSKAIEGRRKI